jgi:hypothetical protein
MRIDSMPVLCLKLLLKSSVKVQPDINWNNFIGLFTFVPPKSANFQKISA